MTLMATLRMGIEGGSEVLRGCDWFIVCIEFVMTLQCKWQARESGRRAIFGRGNLARGLFLGAGIWQLRRMVSNLTHFSRHKSCTRERPTTTPSSWTATPPPTPPTPTPMTSSVLTLTAMTSSMLTPSKVLTPIPTTCSTPPPPPPVDMDIGPAIGDGLVPPDGVDELVVPAPAPAPASAPAPAGPPTAAKVRAALRALQKKMETAHANLEKARSDIANFTNQRAVLEGQLATLDAAEAAAFAAAQQKREAAKAAAQQKREAAKATRKREREQEAAAKAAEREAKAAERAAAAAARKRAKLEEKAQKQAERDAQAAAKASNVETVDMCIIALEELAKQAKLLSGSIATDPVDEIIRKVDTIATGVLELNRDSGTICKILQLAEGDKTRVPASQQARFRTVYNTLDEALQTDELNHGLTARFGGHHFIEIPPLSLEFLLTARLIRDRAEARKAKKKEAAEAEAKKKEAAEAAPHEYEWTMALPTKDGTPIIVSGTFPDPEPELGSSLFGEDDDVQRLRLAQQMCKCPERTKEAFCEDCRRDVCGQECRVCDGNPVGGCGLFCSKRYDE